MSFFEELFSLFRPRDKSRDDEFCALCYSGTAKEVKEALDSWASVKAVSGDNMPVIFHAIKAKRADIIKVLTNAGANISADVSNPNLGTPLTVASAIDDNVEVIKALLEAGANPNAIIKRVESGNFDGVIRTKVVHINALGMSLTQNKNTNNLIALLEGKANPNQRLQDRMTLLMIAALVDFPDAIDALVVYGADVNAEDSKGFTALDTALQFRKYKAARVLKEYGARTNKWLWD